ncbi:MAG: DMT family transporter [Sphaerospermopsis kisseleviana]
MRLHSPSGNWHLGLFLSLVTVVLWGILPLALTVTLKVLDVYSIIWFRFVLSFVILAIYLQINQKFPNGKMLLGFQGKLLLVATVFLAINYWLFLYGLAETTPTNSQVLIQLGPAFLGLGGLAIFKETYSKIQWASLSFLTFGFVLFFHEQLTSLILSANKYLFGSTLIIIAAASWAIYALAQKQLLHCLPSSQIMVTIYGGCRLLFSPFASPQQLLTLSPFHWSILLFCGLNTLVAYGSFAESLQHWEASKVSAVLASTPLVTIFSVSVVSHFAPTVLPSEAITFLGFLGAFFVVCGSVGIALGKTEA